MVTRNIEWPCGCEGAVHFEQDWTENNWPVCDRIYTMACPECGKEVPDAELRSLIDARLTREEHEYRDWRNA